MYIPFPNMVFRRCYDTDTFRNPHQAQYKKCSYEASKTYYRENSIITYSVLQIHTKHLPGANHVQFLI